LKKKVCVSYPVVEASNILQSPVICPPPPGTFTQIIEDRRLRRVAARGAPIVPLAIPPVVVPPPVPLSVEERLSVAMDKPTAPPGTFTQIIEDRRLRRVAARAAAAPHVPPIEELPLEIPHQLPPTQVAPGESQASEMTETESSTVAH
jgi:hypothetical protein